MDKVLAIVAVVLMAWAVLAIASLGYALGGPLLGIAWGLAAAAWVSVDAIEMIKNGWK